MKAHGTKTTKTSTMMASKQNRFGDRLFGARKVLLPCLILVVAVVLASPTKCPFAVEATAVDKNASSLRGQSIRRHRRSESIASQTTYSQTTNSEIPLSNNPSKVRRKLLSKKRYFARYSGSVGRASVQRCAKSILEDDDDTDYTVFEVDFEIEVDIDADIGIDEIMQKGHLVYDQDFNYDISSGGSSSNNDDVEGCISSLRKMNDILDVEEDRRVSLFQESLVSPSSSTEGFEEGSEEFPWNVEAIQADWVPPGSNKVTVCVVDTGIAANHPGFPSTPSSTDLGEKGIYRIKGKDFRNLSFTGGASGTRLMKWNRDINGHGTHVAGVIFNVVDASRYITGTPNNVELFVVSAFDGNDVGYESDVVRAVRTCVGEAKADVINLSLGNVYPSSFSAALYASIVEQGGAIMVAAAGNKHEGAEDFDFYPASIPSVISVGAVERGGSHFPSSIRNNQVELVGPGHEILSTGVRWNEEKSEMEYVYERRSGTSSAAPHVTGAVALLKSHYPTCSSRQIRYAMAKTAVRSENKNSNSNSEEEKTTECDSAEGYGSIQVRDALDWLLFMGGCDSWDVELTSLGGCSTLSGGIVQIKPEDESDGGSHEQEPEEMSTSFPEEVSADAENANKTEEDSITSLEQQVTIDPDEIAEETPGNSTIPSKNLEDLDENTARPIEESTTSPTKIELSNGGTKEPREDSTKSPDQEFEDDCDHGITETPNDQDSTISPVQDEDSDENIAKESEEPPKKEDSALRGWTLPRFDDP